MSPRMLESKKTHRSAAAAAADDAQGLFAAAPSESGACRSLAERRDLLLPKVLLGRFPYFQIRPGSKSAGIEKLAQRNRLGARVFQ